MTLVIPHWTLRSLSTSSLKMFSQGTVLKSFFISEAHFYIFKIDIFKKPSFYRLFRL